jgi:flavodoxin
MNTAVRYYSKSGNTKKLAEAIAKSVGTTAESIDKAIAEPVELLLLGGAVYAGKIDTHLRDFISRLSPNIVKSVAVFSTAAGGKSIQPQVAELLKGKGIPIIGDGFSCKGKFLLANLGRPNEQDCAAAAEFTKNLLKGLGD